MFTEASIDAIYAIGHYQLSRGDFHDAASVFRGMVVLAPNDERGWLGLGACHDGLEQYAVALQMYEAGADVVVHSVRCKLAAARTHHRLGDTTRAEDAIHAAEQLADDQSDSELADLVAAVRSELQ